MRLDKSDGDVVARAEWAFVAEPTTKRKGDQYVFTLNIDDNGQSIAAANVFLAAADFWGNLLGELFFIEGRIYVEGRPVTI